MHALELQIETLSKEETALIAQNEQLEKKVSMMRPGTTDKDLLEERVRAVLGYQKPNEFTILGHKSR